MKTPSDIKERLRTIIHGSDYEATRMKNPDGPEAADRIAELEAEVEKLHKFLNGRDNYIAANGLWNDFIDTLDNPPPPREKLKSLLSKRPLWGEGE